jgi:Lon protease-like protein
MDWAPKRPVPVFPLPDVVLFPGAEMRLHVFELRYRTLVRDALSSERLIGLATLAPGWEGDYEGSPAFLGLGCVARFEEVEWLPNDCYDLRIRGEMRAHFGRVVREFPYRACTVETVPEAPYSEDDPLAAIARQGLLEERSRLGPLGAEVWIAPPVFESSASLAVIAGTLATTAKLSTSDKLALLAEDNVVERARLLRERLRQLGPTSTPPEPPPELGRN